MKKNYKMVVSYDGSRYKGWQRLKDQDLTVQGKSVIQEVFHGGIVAHFLAPLIGLITVFFLYFHEYR